MKLKINDRIPNSKVFILNANGPSSFELEKLFKNRKILLVSVPGAFTPTCALDHIPGYVKYYDEFVTYGIDELYVIAVNDPFVMDAWIKSYKSTGERLSRFAMLIEDCVVRKIFDEEGGGLDISKAENVIKLI